MKNPKEIAETQFLIGKKYIAINRDSSLKYLELASELCTDEKSDFICSNVFLELASVYGKYGDFEKSDRYAQKASDQYIVQGNLAKSIRSRSIIGLNKWKSSKYDDGIVLYLQLIEEADSLDLRKAMIPLYNNIGLIYNDVKERDKAIQYYKEGLVLADEYGDKRGISLLNNNISIILRHQDKFEESNQHLSRTIEVAGELNDQISVYRGYSNLGANYVQMENYPLADKYLKRALIHYRKVDYEMGMIKTHWHLGELYLKKDDFMNAKIYTDSSLALSYKLDIEEDIRYAFEQLRDIAIAEGSKSEIESYIDSVDLYDKLIMEEIKAKEIAEAELKYKTNALKNDLEFSEMALENSRISKRNLLWIFLCSLLGTVFMLSFFYNKRQRATTRERLKAEKKLSEQINSKLENYKKDMASKLHDEIGQELAILKVKSQTGEKDDIISTIDNTMDLVRSLSSELYPYQLDRLGPNTSFQMMVRKLNEQSKVRFTADLNELDGIIDEKENLVLYRIIQEGFNNVLKHSEATSAHVFYDKGLKVLSIFDNGKGIENPSNTGLGILAMKANARSIDAGFTIENREEGGTVIKIKLNRLL